MNYELDLKVLKLAMLNKGYSMNKLAEMSDLGKVTVSRVVKRGSTNRQETIFKMAKALDLKAEDLIISEEE
ncbi:helix-turn-helix domain-containing protein [Clostridioides mangenotii]|uniref:helix-turn-helix domain-containing protein n=1 Tax=Metaclostridioides mangenotii TaxID=1540 RepID=UPI001C1153AB|nr:helix-turn-helix transcriptional regulator [Clostridioides mangenotii]MBU5308524.1 helix-turn-helix domain-containing protein [Clostridioides mangenotii]